MANLLGALGGAGAGLSNWGSTFQKTQADRENSEGMARLTDELAGNRARALEQFKMELVEGGRTKMNAAIDTKARGIIDSRMQGHQVADPSTWTPEQEAARNMGMSRMAQDPRTRATAAAQAGYIDEAAKLDKIADSGASNIPFGSARVDGEGTVIYDNGMEYKRTLEQQRADAATTRANAAQTRAEGGGAGGGRGGQFEEKQWDAAYKPEKSIVSMPTPLGDKDTDSAALRGFYKSVFNYARGTGDYTPAEANEYASINAIKMRDKAMARSTASKGKLSPEQAASQILTEYQQAMAKSKESAGAGATPSRGSATSPRAGESDQVMILQTELKAAQQRLAEGDSRAQGDIDALNREIERAGGKKSSGRGANTHDGLPARQNKDGSYSTEVSITVTDPRLNGGKPTNIPSLWGGKEVDENTAVKNALATKKTYQSYGSIDEAVAAAKEKSNAGGAIAPAPAAKTDAAPKLEWEQKRDEAKALDSQIAEVRRDYNLATSVRGGKGVSPETKAKIKARLDQLIGQQKDLYSQSDSLYRAADRQFQQRSTPSQNLNAKYQ